MFYWYVKVMRRYVGFAGRARRREFWYFGLVNFFIIAVLSLGAALTGGGIDSHHPQPTIGTNVFSVLYTLYALAVLIPSLAVSVRRLHDTGRSGWWLFINFIPFLGALILLFFYVQDSQPGDNRYGPNPKAPQFAPVQTQRIDLYKPPQ